jgi:long-chain acyl-CoA synthetase
MMKGEILVMSEKERRRCHLQQIEAWYPEFKATASEDTHMGALPVFHSFGMTCAVNYPIWAGFAIVLISRPEPKPLLDAVKTGERRFIRLISS